jgi:hypothetical protein
MLPIHVKLKTALTSNDIYYKITYENKTEFIEKNLIVSKIESIMQLLSENEISNQEILIEICDLNLPIFEFYDLPGIRAYPPEMAKQTLELSEHYIQQPNTIIVCVIPATTPRLTSYQPIALVNKYKKQDNTILALTIADRIQQENIYELLISRIINDTDEFENNKFAGCIAIINRSHHNIITLEDNDKYEHEWFEKNIISQIPDDYSIEDKNLILKNIKINNLISNLDVLYNNFIKQKWIPYTIENFNEKIKINENEYEKLGIDIDKINMREFIDYYKKYFINVIINKIGVYNEDYFDIGNIKCTENELSKYLSDEDYTKPFFTNLSNYELFFDYLLKRLTYDIYTCIPDEKINIVNLNLVNFRGTNRKYDTLIDNLSKKSNYNIKRFFKLNYDIINNILKIFNEKITFSLNVIKPSIMYVILDDFNELKFIKKLNRLIELIRKDITIDENIFENLEEDIEYQQKRKLLQEKYKSYIEAIQQMNELQLKI